MKAELRHFYIASAPAALLGCWGLGRQIAGSAVDASSIWQLTWLARTGIYHEDPGVLITGVIGLSFLAPLLVLALIVSRIWAEVFSRLRDRPLDAGWHLTAWIFVLLLPATMPLGYAALGLSFGVVFGSQVVGGTGRYLVNPALLGIVFLAFAYPSLTAAGAWVPGTVSGIDGLSSWAILSRDGVAVMLEDRSIAALWLGDAVGPIGTTSALSCLLGAAYLLGARVASWRVLVAALSGLALAAAIAGGLPWHWHLAVGNFAFLLAFVATDPTVQPRTGGGKLAYGMLFAGLTVVLRTANPEHPEGTQFALLLAMLSVPLLDYLLRAAMLGRLPDEASEDHETA
jgi:Na+-transporting NADH:ubiquinone oxidoreductase subunit B